MVNELKSISFQNKELEKRRLQLLEAFEKEFNLPADEIDLYILNKATPGVLSTEESENFEKQIIELYGSCF